MRLPGLVALLAPVPAAGLLRGNLLAQRAAPDASGCPSVEEEEDWWHRMELQNILAQRCTLLCRKQDLFPNPVGGQPLPDECGRCAPRISSEDLQDVLSWDALMAQKLAITSALLRDPVKWQDPQLRALLAPAHGTWDGRPAPPSPHAAAPAQASSSHGSSAATHQATGPPHLLVATRAEHARKQSNEKALPHQPTSSVYHRLSSRTPPPSLANVLDADLADLSNMGEDLQERPDAHFHQAKDDPEPPPEEKAPKKSIANLTDSLMPDMDDLQGFLDDIKDEVSSGVHEFVPTTTTTTSTTTTTTTTTTVPVVELAVPPVELEPCNFCSDGQTLNRDQVATEWDGEDRTCGDVETWFNDHALKAGTTCKQGKEWYAVTCCFFEMKLELPVTTTTTTTTTTQTTTTTFDHSDSVYELHLRVDLQNEVAALCDKQCIEVGAYPFCTACPKQIAAVPKVLSWDKLTALVNDFEPAPAPAPAPAAPKKRGRSALDDILSGTGAALLQGPARCKTTHQQRLQHSLHTLCQDACRATPKPEESMHVCARCQSQDVSDAVFLSWPQLLRHARHLYLSQ